MGQLERALVLYEALALEFPDSVAAKTNLAVVLLKVGRASAARALLEEVVRGAPDYRRAWGYLGAALEQLGLIAEAEEALVAGHFASAAKRLRERHGGAPSPAPESRAEIARRERARREARVPPAHAPAGSVDGGPGRGRAEPRLRLVDPLRGHAAPAGSRRRARQRRSDRRAAARRGAGLALEEISLPAANRLRRCRTRRRRTGPWCRCSTRPSRRSSSSPTKQPSSCTRAGSCSSASSRRPTRATRASSRAATRCTPSPGRSAASRRRAARRLRASRFAAGARRSCASPAPDSSCSRRRAGRASCRSR